MNSELIYFLVFLYQQTYLLLIFVYGFSFVLIIVGVWSAENEIYDQWITIINGFICNIYPIISSIVRKDIKQFTLINRLSIRD